jgi:Cdc6-like AAA superfamily ATPase
LRILKIIVALFYYVGEERKVSFHEVFQDLEKDCRKLSIDKIPYSEMDSAIETFQNYSLIEIDRSGNKKDAKNNKIALNVELEELDEALEAQSKIQF